MEGRDGPESSPDLMVSVFIIATSINYVGFVVSLLKKHLKYMKSKTFPL